MKQGWQTPAAHQLGTDLRVAKTKLLSFQCDTFRCQRLHLCIQRLHVLWQAHVHEQLANGVEQTYRPGVMDVELYLGQRCPVLCRGRNAQAVAPERLKNCVFQRIEAAFKAKADHHRAHIDGAQLVECLTDSVDFPPRAEKRRVGQLQQTRRNRRVMFDQPGERQRLRRLVTQGNNQLL